MNKLVVSLFMLFVLAACGNTSTGLIQGKWTLISYGSPSDQIAAVPDVEAHIEFDSEGSMNGNVGCNGFGGDYSVSGDKINFGPVMSTMMFCEGVADQEMATLAALSESVTYLIEGNTMTITSADGKSSITLER